jgi:hypothetical protein
MAKTVKNPTWTSKTGKKSLINEMPAAYLVNIVKSYSTKDLPVDKIDDFKNVLLELFCRDLLYNFD